LLAKIFVLAIAFLVISVHFGDALGLNP